MGGPAPRLALDVVDGRVARLGPPAAAGAPGAALDLPPGAVVLPGFADHHLHLLALAAARRSVDLRDARSLAEVADRLRDAVRAAGPGGWVRAWGLDEHDLAERRLPDRAELDAIAGPSALVVHHRTGHLRLRSRAAEGRRAPPLPADELAEAVAAVSAELAAAGLVRLCDATHTNDRGALELLAGLPLRQALDAMVGADRLAGVHAGERLGDLRVVAAKVMPPHAGPAQVGRQVRGAHDAGFAVAVHAVDVDEVQLALDAGLGHGDRLEHAGLCLPEQVDALAGAGVTVVTQPSFVTDRSRKYRAELTAVEHGWLYRLRSLLDAGVAVRGSSDAPVVAAGPLRQVAAAVGRALGRDERLAVGPALRLVTEPLVAGEPADLVVLGADPHDVAAERAPASSGADGDAAARAAGRIAAIKVLATWRAGRLIHADAAAWPALDAFAAASEGP